MNKTELWKRVSALSLAAALTLTGCSGGKDDAAADDPKTSAPAESAASAESAAPSAEPQDYSKYNAYLDLSDAIYEMEEILTVYFENVEYEPDFALTEGGDYGALKDALQFYTSNTYVATEALGYIDGTPAYPEVDAAVDDLGDSVIRVMEALDDIAAYLRFDDYVDDDLAQAPELHTELFSALETYDQYYGTFLEAMETLADETRDDDMESLLQEGQMILYNSRLMLHAGSDILDDIWEQLEASTEGADPNAEFTLPPIDLAELEPLYTDLQDAYAKLTEVLADQAEVEKVDSFTGTAGEQFLEMYTNRATTANARVGELMEILRAGGDYADAYDAASEAISDFIDSYNNII